jgi:hypothetical protein
VIDCGEGGACMMDLRGDCPKCDARRKRQEVERETLDAAIHKMEAMNVNATYRQALKKAVKILRDMKP